MKKHSITPIAKRFFLGSLLAATLFLSANAKTQSSSINAVYTPATGKAEVKYTGIDINNQLSFNVKYSNPTGSLFNLVVLDEAGEILFKGFYNEKSFDKTFKLPKSEVSKVTFVIEDGKNSVKEKYIVNIKTSVQEEVIVSKG
jgi:hypothetical protein